MSKEMVEHVLSSKCSIYAQGFISISVTQPAKPTQIISETNDERSNYITAVHYYVSKIENFSVLKQIP